MVPVKQHHTNFSMLNWEYRRETFDCKCAWCQKYCKRQKNQIKNYETFSKSILIAHSLGEYFVRLFFE